MTLWRRIYAERKRVLLPLMVVLAVNAAVLVLAVLPLRSSVAAQQGAALDATMALAQARRLDLQVRDALASKERADSELQRFYADVLPRDFATAQRTANLWLNEAALGAGLVFRGSQFDWTDVRDSRLSRAFSRVTLQGRYPDIRRFLHSVETAEEFIIVEGVELAQSGAASGTGGMLEVSLLVSTYFLTPVRP